MRTSLLKAMHNGPVLADGAMGTALLAAGGVPGPVCIDNLNLLRPELVLGVHRTYLEAGAMLIETNTFGANRLKLAGWDLEGKMEAINRTGAELAREAAGEDRWVAGSMGPLGRLGDAPPPEDELADAFADQARALAAGGVDCIILETFASLTLLLTALRAVKSAVDLPVFTQMVFGQGGRSLSGRDPADCFRTLADHGADAVGLNCGLGPRDAAALLQRLPELDIPLTVFPNAGYPERVEDRLVFASSPEYFGRTTARCAGLGAALLGGCCGTDATHIHALAQALTQAQPEAAPRIGPMAATAAPAAPAAAPPAPGAFAKKLAAGDKMVLVELHPPKHLDMQPALEAARQVALAGADAITVPENPLAGVRLSSVVLSQAIKEQALPGSDAEVMVHITGRDRNLIGMQSTLMGLAAQGLTNILAITGDPPTAGAEERVTGVFDLRSYELIELLETMNQSKNAQGDDLKRPAGFCIGGAFNPNTKNIAMQVRRLEKKMSLGARYFLTQPVFSKEGIDRMLEATSHVDAPLFLGVLPLVSHRNAEFLHNEFPGINIPQEARDRMRAVDGDREKSQAAGVELAWELLEYAWPHLAGAYIIPPFNRYAMATELIGRLR